MQYYIFNYELKVNKTNYELKVNKLDMRALHARSETSTVILYVIYIILCLLWHGLSRALGVRFDSCMSRGECRARAAML